MLLLATAVAYNRAETGWGPYGGCRGVAKPKKNIPNEKKTSTQKNRASNFFFLQSVLENMVENVY